MISYRKKTKPAIWTEMRDNGFGLSPRTDQRPELEMQYRAKADAFLKENKVCAITGEKATEVHHSRSRLGILLIDERFFIPTSKRGHRWVHDNPDAARKRTWNGIPILAELGDWGRAGE